MTRELYPNGTYSGPIVERTTKVVELGDVPGGADLEEIAVRTFPEDGGRAGRCLLALREYHAVAVAPLVAERDRLQDDLVIARCSLKDARWSESQAVDARNVIVAERDLLREEFQALHRAVVATEDERDRLREELEEVALRRSETVAMAEQLQRELSAAQADAARLRAALMRLDEIYRTELDEPCTRPAWLESALTPLPRIDAALAGEPVAERRKGSGRLHGRPLDEDGAIEFAPAAEPATGELRIEVGGRYRCRDESCVVAVTDIRHSDAYPVKGILTGPENPEGGEDDWRADGMYHFATTSPFDLIAPLATVTAVEVAAHLAQCRADAAAHPHLPSVAANLDTAERQAAKVEAQVAAVTDEERERERAKCARVYDWGGHPFVCWTAQDVNHYLFQSGTWEQLTCINESLDWPGYYPARAAAEAALAAERRRCGVDDPSDYQSPPMKPWPVYEAERVAADAPPSLAEGWAVIRDSELAALRERMAELEAEADSWQQQATESQEQYRRVKGENYALRAGQTWIAGRPLTPGDYWLVDEYGDKTVQFVGHRAINNLSCLQWVRWHRPVVHPHIPEERKST